MAILTTCWIVDCTIIFWSLLLASAYLYMTRKFNYWSSRGVMEIKPTPFIGNYGDCLSQRKTGAEFLKDLYEKSKGLKYMGYYVFDKPFIMLRDPAAIKDVLIRDFDCFNDRYAASSDNDVLGTANLFLLKNPRWQNLRTKLTPVFTAAKMKKMFQLLIDVGEDLDAHLEALQANDEGTTIEVKETCAKYATDVIASYAFGLSVNSLNNPDAEFRKYGRKIFHFTLRRAFEWTSFFFIPGIVKPLGFKFFEKSCEEFLRKALWDTIEKRIQSRQRRNDLIDILIELKEAQQNSDHHDPDEFKMDDDNLVAQAAIFFIGGYETSSFTMSFILYDLALNLDIQTKLRNEIKSALKESGGEITYEMVMNLPYLEMVFSETLRKYPPIPFLDRVCKKDYKLIGDDLVIEKGTPVNIPIFALHRDPQYYPDPEKYDPERFNPENKKSRPSCVYLPFGEGPHICIGLRFAQLQSKLGILKIIANYEVTPCEQTPTTVHFDPKSFFVASKGGMFLNIRRIKESN